MTRLLPFTSVMTTATAFAALCAGAGVANAADGFTQNNLVSNMAGLATTTDSSLVNPWGVSFANGSPVWISDQATQTRPLFSVTGSTGVGKAPLFTVNIPPAGAAGPSGQVANAGGMGFNVNGGNGAPAAFIFANLNGSISAWNGTPLTQAFTQTSVAGASFTGLAINKADTELFAANTAGAGGIDVFNRSFNQISLGAGAFATPTAVMAAGLVPFNVTDLGGNVFVTYAPSGHVPQTMATGGQGAVAEFTESGVLEKAFTNNALASPWGVAIAPSSFGKLGGDLLVGNFSFVPGVADMINAFNPVTDAFEGSIEVNPGAGNTPGGLWSIVFGGGGMDGNPNTLFFTDGINGETAGLFGSLTAVPEPSTWAMMLAGFGGLALLAARRRRASPAIG
ncbi:MAG TPA: TIGR03118 family protein [Roseiarcus sp.]